MVVYGVTVAGCDGRAGMAAIVNTDNVDIDTLARAVTDKLPVYARPYFLRLTPKLDITGTYKLKKRDLQEQGYNPDTIEDQLFFLDAKTVKYVPLTKDLYSQITNSKVRF